MFGSNRHFGLLQQSLVVLLMQKAVLSVVHCLVPDYLQLSELLSCGPTAHRRPLPALVAQARSFLVELRLAVLACSLGLVASGLLMQSLAIVQPKVRTLPHGDFAKCLWVPLALVLVPYGLLCDAVPQDPRGLQLRVDQWHHSHTADSAN